MSTLPQCSSKMMMMMMSSFWMQAGPCTSPHCCWWLMMFCSDMSCFLLDQETLSCWLCSQDQLTSLLSLFCSPATSFEGKCFKLKNTAVCTCLCSILYFCLVSEGWQWWWPGWWCHCSSCWWCCWWLKCWGRLALLALTNRIVEAVDNWDRNCSHRSQAAVKPLINNHSLKHHSFHSVCLS